MLLFSDSKCSTPITDIDFEIVEAGGSKDLTIYVKNDTDAHLVLLNFSLNEKNTEVVEAPEAMDPGEVTKLVLRWSPTIKVKKGLKAELNIEGKELWS